jgi:hypothetical protein
MGDPSNFKTFTIMLSTISALPTIEVYLQNLNKKQTYYGFQIIVCLKSKQKPNLF